MSLSRPLPPDTICVLDTQMIIAIKQRMKPSEQWGMLLFLTDLLDAGYVTYPKQVWQELDRAQHPDGPGIWAIGARRLRRYGEPSDDSMADVLGVVPGLLDPNEERNYADPYVVTLAYELQDRFPGSRVVVATENTRDRGELVSPATACKRLGIECLDWEGFLAWCPDIDQNGDRVGPA